MARILMMTDFSESYANQLLQGIIRYSHEHTPWVVSKVPLSIRDGGHLREVADFAVKWKADAIIGQFRQEDDVEMFKQRGILAIAQDYEQRFSNIPNISGEYNLAGQICADYLISRGVKNFGFFGIKGVVWSDGRRDGFLNRILSKVEGANFYELQMDSTHETWWYDLDNMSAWLHDLPKPAAVLACDDNRAYYIIEACKQAKGSLRVPEDIMVLGVDNDVSLCELCDPPLSSLGQDVEGAGYRVAEMIEKLLELPVKERFDAAEDLQVRPTFVTSRRSTSAVVHENPYIEKVLNHIGTHITESVLVDDLVKLVPMNRRALERMFKQEMGTSLHQYIIKARVDRMKELLKEGFMPVQAAAELDTEYKSIARNFKAVTGMTPAAYAEMINNE